MPDEKWELLDHPEGGLCLMHAGIPEERLCIRIAAPRTSTEELVIGRLRALLEIADGYPKHTLAGHKPALDAVMRHPH